MKDFNVESNIWLEVNKKVVLSAWRIKLLLAVQETGSISQAANLMKIPYRRAWEKIRQSEERLGMKLVDTQVGGTGGGGASLTTECLILIDKYNTLTQGFKSQLQHRFKQIFD